MSSLKHLNKIQSDLSMKRFFHTTPDRVWDTRQVKEIPVDDALLIARGLARGVRNGGNDGMSTASKMNDGYAPDISIAPHFAWGAVGAYQGRNTINDPLARVTDVTDAEQGADTRIARMADATKPPAKR